MQLHSWTRWVTMLTPGSSSTTLPHPQCQLYPHSCTRGTTTISSNSNGIQSYTGSKILFISGTQTQNVEQNLFIFLLIALQNHFNNRKHRFCLQIFTNYSAKTNPSKCTNEERLRVSIQANRINHTLVYLSYNFHYYPKSVTVMTSCPRSMCTQFLCAWAWIGPMQATNTS